MVLRLLSKLQDPTRTDGTGYRPKILVLDTEWGLYDSKPHEASFLDLCSGRKLLDVYIGHDERIPLRAEKDMSTTEEIGTRSLCTPHELGSL